MPGLAAPEASSRNRLLFAAKTLFATAGYESTSTAAIARHAGTSESQIIKHFGGKAGLLEAIFTDGWGRLAQATESAMARFNSPVEKLRCIPETVFAGLNSDPALKHLMLLEGRRMRRDEPVVALTDGFLSFIRMIDGVLQEMSDKGQLRAEVNTEAVRSALVGMMEGALRDQLLAERGNFPAGFTTGHLLQIYDLILGALIVDAPSAR